MSNWKKKIKITMAALGTAFIATSIIAKKKKGDSVYDTEPEQKNPFEGKRVEFVENPSEPANADGVCGHLEAIGTSQHTPGMYEDYVKRWIDIVISFGGLVVLSPVLLGIAIAIKIDDPGPALFTQKRVGKNKQYFKLHKFRSMKMSTPHDKPTHMLENPDQYITKVGKFLRAHSLDELPQIWDIFIGNMSVIGPRPGLWNQDLLTSERDKYGANDIKPGLTGWAQINGRDELEIPDKAKLDGEYAKNLSLKFDIKCFLDSLHVFGKDESVVEGGTGEMKKALRPGVPETDPQSELGCDKEIIISASDDKNSNKRVLITGAGSYIGESFRAYAEEHFPNLHIDAIGTMNDEWKEADFALYDCVYHVAGIAHADAGGVDDTMKELYYKVNTDLAIEVAKTAKEAGVKQFVFMSSAIIYGDSAPCGKVKMITRNTAPNPTNFYGDSKWQADRGVRALEGNGFNVAVLRPPMIYGRGSKGNYPTLAKLARKIPVFPNIDNERSMLHIDNLCEFLGKLIMSGEGGIYFPQNAEYTRTSEMVREIGDVSGKKVRVSGIFNPAVKVVAIVPFKKIKGLVNKAFGNMCYDQELSSYSFEYRIRSLKESIEVTEGDDIISTSYEKNITVKKTDNGNKPHILLISQYFHPETFRVNDMACEWVKRGYKVTVLTGIPNYPMGKYFEGYDRKHRTHEKWNGVNIIRIPLIARGNSSNKFLNAGGMAANYFSFIESGRKWVKSKEAEKLHADLVFTFEVSPMTQALIGVWYGKRYHVPTYLYVQDLWPENVETVTGIHNKAIIGPIDKMVDKIYRETDKIFTTSPSFVKAIVNRKVPVDKTKVHYWPQYAEEFYRPMELVAVDGLDTVDDSYKIAFTGNIGTAQGLDVLPKAAKLLKDENVKFVIVGDGRYQPEFERQIDELGVRNKFIMIPRVPAERVPEILSNVDAGFISFNKTALWENTIPAKLQSYMACGKGIIASASGETERVITEAGCGVCCKIGDAEALVDGIKTMMSADSKAMGLKASAYFEDKFDKKKLMDEMDEYFSKGLS